MGKRAYIYLDSGRLDRTCGLTGVDAYVDLVQAAMQKLYPEISVSAGAVALFGSQEVDVSFRGWGFFASVPRQFETQFTLDLLTVMMTIDEEKGWLPRPSGSDLAWKEWGNHG